MTISGRSQSYVHGADAEPLLGRTVGDVLDEAARRWPEGEALVVPHQSIRWTWRDLRGRALDLAAGLVGLGLRPGERVGILAPNLAEWVVVQFATA